MKTIIQVLGPTGVGKSKVAIHLAQQVKGEIISADSMQVYKDFDIGTDKVKPADREKVPHYLIDILSDCSQFNASRFLASAFTIAEQIAGRAKIPIVCGGTALYLKIMIKGIFPESERKTVSRETLERIVERRGLSPLWNKLNRVDPAYAGKIGRNDKIRIIRAMEIYYNNKIPPSEIFRQTQTPFKEYRFIRIGLKIPREELYRRIEQRVDDMIRRGLVEEVRRLTEKYPPSCPPFKSVGYKEILMALQNQVSLPEAICLIKQHSRNFAKRQLSWFGQEKDIQWFDPNHQDEIEAYVRQQFVIFASGGQNPF
jgi:tRNA dimethylallyltransferase